MKYVGVALIVVACAAYSFLVRRPARITVELERREVRNGLVFTQLQVECNTNISRISCLMLPADSYRMEIVDQPDRSDQRPLLRDIAQSRKAIAAIDGGFFEPDFSATGLYVIDGKPRSFVSAAPHLSAIVWCDAQNRLHIDRSAGFDAPAHAAVQAGPLLIDPNAPYSTDSSRKARRTAIAIGEHNEVLLIHAEDITLTDLAAVLRQYAEQTGVSKVRIAANLDGGPSAGMFVALTGEQFVKNESGPIRNALVFTPKRDIGDAAR